MYKVIVDMLEDGLTPEQVAAKLDLPLMQVYEIEADFYEFV